MLSLNDIFKRNFKLLFCLVTGIFSALALVTVILIMKGNIKSEKNKMMERIGAEKTHLLALAYTRNYEAIQMVLESLQGETSNIELSYEIEVPSKEGWFHIEPVDLRFSENNYGYIVLKINFLKAIDLLVLIPLILSFVLIFIFTMMIYKRLKHSLFDGVIRPLSELNGVIDRVKAIKALRDIPKIDTQFKEIGNVFEALRKSSLIIAENEEQLREAETLKAQSELASQVAHDIGSPLTALNMVMSTSGDFPESQRLLIRSAIDRIQGIASDLRKNYYKPKQVNSQLKDDGHEQVLSSHMLSSLLVNIVQEKRVTFSDRTSVEIDALIDESAYGVFAKVQPIELKRILSNLINNSMDAIEGRGKVYVRLIERGDKVSIIVMDNGRGISPEILPKLGRKGETFGKKNGVGLGLYHACKKVEQWGGQLRIDSNLGNGTRVEIELPTTEPVPWFIDKIRVQDGQTVAVIDDDLSIHEVWTRRFADIRSKNLNLDIRHFHSPREIEKWYDLGNHDEDVLYLVDYEFQKNQKNGIELIKKLNIQNQSVLVTSSHEDKDIQVRCERMHLSLVPKCLANIVPLEVQASL